MVVRLEVDGRERLKETSKEGWMDSLKSDIASESAAFSSEQPNEIQTEILEKTLKCGK